MDEFYARQGSLPHGTYPSPMPYPSMHTASSSTDATWASYASSHGFASTMHGLATPMGQRQGRACQAPSQPMVPLSSPSLEPSISHTWEGEGRRVHRSEASARGNLRNKSAATVKQAGRSSDFGSGKIGAASAYTRALVPSHQELASSSSPSMIQWMAAQEGDLPIPLFEFATAPKRSANTHGATVSPSNGSNVFSPYGHATCFGAGAGEMGRRGRPQRNHLSIHSDLNHGTDFATPISTCVGHHEPEFIDQGSLKHAQSQRYRATWRTLDRSPSMNSPSSTFWHTNRSSVPGHHSDGGYGEEFGAAVYTPPNAVFATPGHQSPNIHPAVAMHQNLQAIQQTLTISSADIQRWASEGRTRRVM